MKTILDFFVGWKLKAAIAAFALLAFSLLVWRIHRHGFNEGTEQATMQCTAEKNAAIAMAIKTHTEAQARLDAEHAQEIGARDAKIADLKLKKEKTRVVYLESKNANPMPSVCVVPADRVRIINAARN